MEIRDFDLTGPIIAVHAHPDDETLTSGGLLASAVASGLQVTLVTCTRGEQGEVIGEDPLKLEGNPDALGRFREQELARAMEALGVTDHLFLDQLEDPQLRISDNQASSRRYVDSGMAWVSGDLGAGVSGTAALPEEVPQNAFYFCDLDAAARRLARLIEARGANTVVTYEPSGGYGHPDHIRAHQVARRAVDLANSNQGDSAVRLFGAIIPAALARTARAQLVECAKQGQILAVREGGQVLEVDAPYATVASHNPEIVYALDVRSVLSSVANAMSAHQTQIKWVELVHPQPLDEEYELFGSYSLSNDIVAPILSHEFYAEF